MAIGAIWSEIWDEAIWDTAIWSQEAAIPEPGVLPVTLHAGKGITIGIERSEISGHHSRRIVTNG